MRGRSLEIGLIVVWGAASMLALLPGAHYYALPFSERAFSAEHRLFAPTGLVGHSYGIVGAAIIAAGVASYSLRKRSRLLSRVGTLKTWLQLHIFCCTFGPFLVLLHTSFKFGGIVSISFFSMVLVVASGVFGRYVYVRIPKTVNGRFQTLEEMRREREVLLETIRGQANRSHVALPAVAMMAPHNGSLARAVAANLGQELANRRQANKLRHHLMSQGVPQRSVASLVDSMRRQAQLERQIVFLQPFQQLFRYWHVFHLPFAIIMFVVLALHVGVAIAFGYGWPF
jgi:hypothetical protein